MKISQRPEPDQIQELLKGPADTPVVMVNLLRFKQRAEGEEGSGTEAYGRYAERMQKIVEAGGGRFLFAARIDSQVIGESDFPFDVIGLVEYPSRREFLQIVSSPEVAEITGHRSAGLEGQWLLASTQVSGVDE